MNIALIGYGKMGKEIEKIAIDRGHNVNLIIDLNNQDQLTTENLAKSDVVIEFTTPKTAYENIQKCLSANTPVVSGTTGWLDKINEVKEQCKEKGKGLFYASNYSIGVNLFFNINKQLAKLMNNYPSYEVSMEETHHLQKLDSPSGTALTLVDGLVSNIDRKDGWKEGDANSNEINIEAFREPDVPGIHSVIYDNEIDFIKITHSAKSRKGFAMGAVLAAEYMNGKSGFYGMEDLMNS